MDEYFEIVSPEGSKGRAAVPKASIIRATILRERKKQWKISLQEAKKYKEVLIRVLSGWNSLNEKDKKEKDHNYYLDELININFVIRLIKQMVECRPEGTLDLYYRNELKMKSQRLSNILKYKMRLYKEEKAQIIMLEENKNF